MLLLFSFEPIYLLAQDAAQDAAPDGAFRFLQSPWLPLLMIGILFYFMLLRPERRKRAELQQMLNNLKKNDRVVTAGGIVGTIVNVQKGAAEVSLRVDENSNTRLRVLRSSISRVITADDAGDASESS